LHPLPAAVSVLVAGDVRVEDREQVFTGEQIGERAVGPRVQRVLALEPDLELAGHRSPASRSVAGPRR
jgi:hypothetical protein